MDQKTNSALADCYSQISDIWLSTAKIARDKIAPRISKIDAEFLEAFERRCCIRAGYYARRAEQHRPPPGHFEDDDGWVVASPRSVAEYANDVDEAIKRAHDPKKRRKRLNAR